MGYWTSATAPDDLANNVINNEGVPKFKVTVTKIPLRSEYAKFSYSVFTSDNVPLKLEGTFFWQIVDVPKMFGRTADPKGDVWHHTRVALIQAVSRVTLKEFQDKFNEIVRGASSIDVDFFTDRGTALHSLELSSFECVDERTAEVLQEIIQETTNRENRLQKQLSENEVERERMAAQIDIERQRAAYVEAKAANEKLQALV